MREVVKNGVTIDVCPDCKGVWLDRGELDKLMQGVKELRSETDSFNGAGSPAPGSYRDQLQNGGWQNQGVNMGQPPQQQGYGAGAAQPREYGSQQPGPGSYGTPRQGGYGSQQSGGSYGSQQQAGHYGGHTSYGSYGSGKHGHGYPHKKKKSVLDVLGDLFD